jgi:hypothetical protein
VVRKTEVVEHLLDDVDGSVAAESVTFAIDGKSYEIDLSKKNAKALRADLDKWATHARKPARVARRATRRRSTGASTSAPAAAPTSESATVRAWANANGVAVPARGRIPREVLEQYHAAN